MAKAGIRQWTDGKPGLAERVCFVKAPTTYRVAPDKALEHWCVMRDGKRRTKLRKQGLSREKAMKKAFELAERKSGPVLLLIHKTRYIVDQHIVITG